MDAGFIHTTELKIVTAVSITNTQVYEAATYFRGTSHVPGDAFLYLNGSLQRFSKISVQEFQRKIR